MLTNDNKKSCFLLHGFGGQGGKSSYLGQLGAGQGVGQGLGQALGQHLRLTACTPTPKILIVKVR